MGQANNPAEAIQDIEQRRLALQRLVVIAHSLEQLTQGLESTLLMGRPTGSIPQSALTALAQLDEKTSILPDAKLKHTVDLLEASIQTKLARIIKLVLLEDEQLVAPTASGGAVPATPDLGKMLGEFRKNAQTTVALKVLLKRRGVPTKPLVISVPENEIKHHIQALKSKESVYRGQLQDKIEGMVADTRGILRMEGLSEDMREATRHVLEDLEANLQHLKAGKSMETLPMALEVIEMDAGLPMESEVVAAAVAEPEVVAGVNEPAPVQPAPAASSDPLPAGRPGVLKSILLWFKTPSAVTWSDIRRGRGNPKP
jgi:hypothetical protein